MRQLKILVAPLDWGLGHATRSIPIIHELLSRGCIVEIAGSGNAGDLLLQEFPSLTHYAIPGYDISYPSKAKQFMMKMVFQLPRIYRAIKKEHRWLHQQQQKKQWDIIISDNRYGLWYPAIKTIFITHQLHVMSGWGKPIDWLIQQLHYRMILRFNHCWVPDNAAEPSLAGQLSHPQKIPRQTTYIGPLSRFIPSTQTGKKIVVALSGPEPQRSILENKLMLILSDAQWDNQEILFLRGIPRIKGSIPVNKKNWQIIDHLNSKAFSDAIAEASLVICRSGYSSVMDLVRLQKKALLIPTPGQTEQEYLARWLEEKNLFYTCRQDDPSLEKMLKKAVELPNPDIQMNFEGYKKAMDDLGIQ